MSNDNHLREGALKIYSQLQLFVVKVTLASYDNAGDVAREIDHILDITFGGNRQDSRVFRSADYFKTSRRLIATLEVCIRFHLEKLRDWMCA